MIFFVPSSTKSLLNASTASKLVYKDKRFLCLCGNWLSRRQRKRNMMTSAIYGIETEEGIFEVKPITNQIQQQQQKQQNLPTSLFGKKRFLQFYHSTSIDTNPIEQLLSLQKISNEQSNVSVYKGFRVSHKYQPTFAITTETVSSHDNNEEYGLTKTVFEFTDDGTLRYAGNESDYCLIKYQGTHPVFNEQLSTFAPVYKTLEQAKSNLSKVLCIFIPKLHNSTIVGSRSSLKIRLFSEDKFLIFLKSTKLSCDIKLLFQVHR